MTSRSLPGNYPDKWKRKNPAEVALNWSFKTIKLLKESMRKSSFSKILEFLSTHHHLFKACLRLTILQIVNLCINTIASLCSLMSQRTMSLWTSIGPKHSAHYHLFRATKVVCSSSKTTRLSYTIARARPNAKKSTVSAVSWLWITCLPTPTTVVVKSKNRNVADRQVQTALLEFNRLTTSTSKEFIKVPTSTSIPNVLSSTLVLVMVTSQTGMATELKAARRWGLQWMLKLCLKLTAA